MASIVAKYAGRLLEAAYVALRRRPLRFGSGREYCLAWLLGVMDTAQLPFDPDMNIRGFEHIEAAASQGRGLLVISTHANAGLTRLLLRCLDDAHLPAVVISTAGSFPICGTGRTVATIRPSGAFLVAVRTRFRKGMIVGAMLDTVDTDGNVIVRDPLMQVATRWHVPIVFASARIEGHRVVLEFALTTST